MLDVAILIHANDPTSPSKHIAWRCVGCGQPHVIPVVGTRHPPWVWNRSLVSPTLSPSVLNTPTEGAEGVRCHLFMRDGVIQFCGDSKHELAGMSVAMKPDDANPFG